MHGASFRNRLKSSPVLPAPGAPSAALPAARASGGKPNRTREYKPSAHAGRAGSIRRTPFPPPPVGAVGGCSQRRRNSVRPRKTPRQPEGESARACADAEDPFPHARGSPHGQASYRRVFPCGSPHRQPAFPKKRGQPLRPPGLPGPARGAASSVSSSAFPACRSCRRGTSEAPPPSADAVPEAQAYTPALRFFRHPPRRSPPFLRACGSGSCSR